MIIFMLRMIKLSIQIELERFFPQAEKEKERMSEQAFSLARGKIKWTAFEELFRLSVSSSYEEEPPSLWHGLFVMAIDWSEAALPRDLKLREHYGTNRKTKRPAGKISLLYDVPNDIVVDGSLYPYDTDGRVQAKEHIKWLKENHPVDIERVVRIFDSGYPSKEFIEFLKKEGVHYLMRCSRATLNK
jgi:hypothetical protein